MGLTILKPVISGLMTPAISAFVRFPGSSPGLKARNNQAMILVALIVVMSLDHWLWSLHFGMLFFWLALGLAHRDSCG